MFQSNQPLGYASVKRHVNTTTHLQKQFQDLARITYRLCHFRVYEWNKEEEEERELRYRRVCRNHDLY